MKKSQNYIKIHYINTLLELTEITILRHLKNIFQTNINSYCTLNTY
jgi:hypothetical protein